MIEYKVIILTIKILKYEMESLMTLEKKTLNCD
jgi:hypothetical protein